MTSLTGTVEKGILGSVLDAVIKMVEEGRIIVLEDGIRVRGTDPADVGVVIFEIDEDAFIEYDSSPTNICVDFTELLDMINVADSNQEVDFELKSHDLELNIMDLSFTLTLLDPQSLGHDRDIPDLELNAEVVLDSEAFKRGVRGADLIADHVEFGIDASNDAFYMEAKGDDNQVILQKPKRDLSTMTSSPTEAIYSVEYLKMIHDSVPDDTQVRIKFDEEYPTEISFHLADGDISAKYFISPRLGPE